MNKVVKIDGRDVNVSLSNAAIKVLAHCRHPVQVEMELYFSCLVRKRVNFSEATGVEAGMPITDNLNLVFRPVMTKACGLDYTGEAPPLTDFPIENAAAFIPKWLRIDYRRGEWQGEFGY